MEPGTCPNQQKEHEAAAAGATAAGVARAALLRQVKLLGKRIWKNPARMFAPSVPPLKIVKDRVKRHHHPEVETKKPGLRHLWHELKAKGILHAATSVVPAFVANAVTGVILFNTYSALMKRFSDLHHDDQVKEFHHALHHTATAGAAAGFAQSFLSAPIDTLTIRTEMDHEMRDWIHQIQQRSISSLWRGLHLTIARDTMSFAVFFSSYEAIKQSVRTPYLERREEVNTWAKDSLGLAPDTVKSLVRVSWTLGGGMLAGTLQQLIDTPFRTVRYALEALNPDYQTYLYRDARHYISTILREHTWQHIVRQTFGAGLFRAMPPAAIAFAIFETTLNWDD